MTGEQAVIVDGLASLPLEQSQPAIYDRPIELRLLYQDPVSGAEHYLIRYPAGLRAQQHRHTAAHTMIVLEGRILANETVVGPGAYVHFPAGTVMYHGPADDAPCLFVIIFHGPFDVHAAE
jgi:quercetin dioxygenase-like cupin family protein